jgi:hypothetical protein
LAVSDPTKPVLSGIIPDNTQRREKRMARKSPHEIWDEEMKGFPTKITRIAAKSADPYARTWEYFVGAYGMAFDRLAEIALENWEGGQMTQPLFFLARHSMELSLKDAIVAYANAAGRTPTIEGHSLLRLWNELRKELRDAGWIENDNWQMHCHELINHLHEIDPDGERFRYPANIKGTSFEPSQVDLQELGVAHWHVGMFCDGCVEMLDAIGRQRG